MRTKKEREEEGLEAKPKRDEPPPTAQQSQIADINFKNMPILTASISKLISKLRKKRTGDEKRKST